MKTRFSTIHKAMVGTCLAGLLAACSDSNETSSPAEAQFEVQVTNLTFAQPLSPVLAVMHRAGFNSFIDGEPATNGLELMAEGGDNSELRTEAQAATQYISSESGSGPVGPGSQAAPIVISVPASELNDLQISLATMLVHTNDAFTAINAMDISNMSVGSQRTVRTPTWDAGTEENTEESATMPGPDFGGEGFNATRLGDLDLVRFHQGVVTSASLETGLASSDLAERHRFDNPTAKVVITRVQ